MGVTYTRQDNTMFIAVRHLVEYRHAWVNVQCRFINRYGYIEPTLTLTLNPTLLTLMLVTESDPLGSAVVHNQNCGQFLL